MASSSGPSLAGRAGGDDGGSNTTTTCTTAASDNYDSNSSKNNKDNSGGSGEVTALAVQQQQQHQLQQRPSDGVDVIMNIDREAMELYILASPCPFNELAGLLDAIMHGVVAIYRKEVVFSMRSPILYKKPEIRKAIKAALAFVAEDFPPTMLDFVRGKFVEGLPKIPGHILKELDETEFFQSTLAGVVVRYVLRGESIMSHHHDQVNQDVGQDCVPQDEHVDQELVKKTPAAASAAASTAAFAEDSAAAARKTRARGHSSSGRRSGRSLSPRRSRSPAPRPQVVEKTTEIAQSTLFEDEGIVDIFDVEPPESAPPSASSPVEPTPLPKREGIEGISTIEPSVEPPASASPSPMANSQAKNAYSIADEVVVDDACDMNNGDSPGPDKRPLALSSSTTKQATHVVEPPASASPPSLMAKSHVKKACSIAVEEEEVAVDDTPVGSSDGHDDGDCSSPNKSPPPPLSSSSDEGSATPPPTPPLSPSLASSSSMDDLPPSTPRTFSANPLGGMFSPPLDKPDVAKVIQDVLCSKRVMNYRGKAAKVMKEVKSGCVSGETMEWVVRGLRSVKGKKELKQRHGGLVFVGPQWGAPLYKTGNGVGPLLRGVAKKHGAGTKFVVCVSSGSSGDNSGSASNIKMITGSIISAPSNTPTAASSASSATSGTSGRFEPVMDGDAPDLQDWSSVRGNLNDGARLWAWIY